MRALPCSEEHEFLIAAGSGDAEAFAALYDRYHPLVFRMAHRVLGDTHGAEDVVQSVFISVWKSPPAVHHGSFAGWLTCVTRNRARDAMRARNSRRESAWPENLTAPDAVDELVHVRMEGRRVRTALATLPETQRRLIELGFFGERSHAELAELTCLPLGTVKTRIRSGLQKLRYTLSAPGVAV